MAVMETIHPVQLTEGSSVKTHKYIIIYNSLFKMCMSADRFLINSSIYMIQRLFCFYRKVMLLRMDYYCKVMLYRIDYYGKVMLYRLD